jgi:hypothetical protein
LTYDARKLKHKICNYDDDGGDDDDDDVSGGGCNNEQSEPTYPYHARNLISYLEVLVEK